MAQQVYIYRGEQLRLAVRTSVACAIVVSGQIEQKNGRIARFHFDYTPTATNRSDVYGYSGNLNTEGWIRNCDVYLRSGNVRRGQCYVDVTILGITYDIPREMITSGYLTSETHVTYPQKDGPLDGPGYLGASTTNPAAGSGGTIACPNNARWKIIACQFQLVTDANAANRHVYISLWGKRFYAVQLHVASTTYDYYFVGPHTFAAAVNNKVMVGFEPQWLQGGESVSITCDNIQAGDNFGVITLTYEEWIEE